MVSVFGSLQLAASTRLSPGSTPISFASLLLFTYSHSSLCSFFYSSTFLPLSSSLRARGVRAPLVRSRPLLHLKDPYIVSNKKG